MPKPRRHRFHFTPERLLLSLLPVWGSLFLLSAFIGWAKGIPYWLRNLLGEDFSRMSRS